MWLEDQSKVFSPQSGLSEGALVSSGNENPAKGVSFPDGDQREGWAVWSVVDNRIPVQD